MRLKSLQHPPRRQREQESWKTGGAECSSGSIRQRGETIAIQPKAPARRSWPQRAGRAEIRRNGERQRWCAFRDPHPNTAADDRSVLGKGNGWRSSIVSPEGQRAKEEFRNLCRVCTASWPMVASAWRRNRQDCCSFKPPSTIAFAGCGRLRSPLPALAPAPTIPGPRAGREGFSYFLAQNSVLW